MQYPQPEANVPPSFPAEDDPYYAARQAVVEQINRDRRAAGLRPVAFDWLASQVGDQHCQEMAARGYLSHWNLRGLLPYHRYHFAGGRDHLQENLSRMTVVSLRPDPISTEPEDVQAHLLHAHQRFMDEAPPLDGHRQNVLDPGHTHVGIGLAVVGGDFTMAEEFLNRYVALEPLPAALPAGSIRIQGAVLNKEYGPYYCVLFYEGWPQPRTVEELNRTYAYEDMTGQIVARVPPWEMSFNPSNGGFRFQAPVRQAGPGYYHLVLWVRRPHRSIPYALGAPGAYQIDTALGVPCAGWVFRQEQ
ncbi:MAG TPA: CAP domain-containing protein [Terriglobia bacterium]|nr:CAP domain-containing protein [Terriglobia bacterium]